jgi:3-oxoacyl-[acyl-carrier-protein] synthase-1
MFEGDSLHIIATGCATALGGYQDATFAAARANMANFVEHPFLLDLGGEPYKVAMAPFIDENMQGFPRLNPLLNYALSDAFTDFEELPDSIPCVLALPEPRYTFKQEDAVQLVRQLLIDCTGLHISTQDLILGGHTAAYQALAQVRQYLSEPSYEFCILAAVDSWIDSDTLNLLEADKYVKTQRNAYGFTPGEAAASLLFCRQQTLRKYQLLSLGKIPSFAISQEPVHHRTGVCTGQGLTQAMRDALETLPTSKKVGLSICDLNGEPHRSDEFGFSMLRLRKHFHKPDEFLTPADCWGDVGAASGALHMIMASIWATEDTAESPILLWGGSASGSRASCLFQA